MGAFVLPFQLTTRKATAKSKCPGKSIAASIQRVTTTGDPFFLFDFCECIYLVEGEWLVSSNYDDSCLWSVGAGFNFPRISLPSITAGALIGKI